MFWYHSQTPRRSIAIDNNCNSLTERWSFLGPTPLNGMQQMIQYNGKVKLLYSRLLCAAADGGDAAGGTFANRLTIFSRCGLKLRSAKLARQIYFACYATTRRRHRCCRILLFYFIRTNVYVCWSYVCVCVCVCNAFLFFFDFSYTSIYT